MTGRAAAARLADGRLHLQDGPIDLIIGIDGNARSRGIAFDAAIARFDTILDELCAELHLLRATARPNSAHLHGQVARRMNEACALFLGETWLTPMAAVAGAVAQEILDAMTAATPMVRAYVNNGGDIALHLSPGTRFDVGVVPQLDKPTIAGIAAIKFADPVRGIATSGRAGRSFSLGIADAVTVLAATAAAADAAATVIGNAVDLPGHPAVLRRPARELQPDSDLGERAVTCAVGTLKPSEVAAALDVGTTCARTLHKRGLIVAAYLLLDGKSRVIGDRHGLLKQVRSAS
jgi:ApbE superfamily uncharacterized protein (UPF0280 family)